jgi:hypothetical protein
MRIPVALGEIFHFYFIANITIVLVTVKSMILFEEAGILRGCPVNTNYAGYYYFSHASARTRAKQTHRAVYFKLMRIRLVSFRPMKKGQMNDDIAGVIAKYFSDTVIATGFCEVHPAKIHPLRGKDRSVNVKGENALANLRIFRQGEYKPPSQETRCPRYCQDAAVTGARPLPPIGFSFGHCQPPLQTADVVDFIGPGE